MWVQAQAQDVDWWAQQRAIDPIQQRRQRVVRGHQVPMAINRERRVWRVPRKHQIDSFARIL
jgi:hypothetical protein